jgi:DNA-binding MarR family transcriptional regulator
MARKFDVVARLKKEGPLCCCGNLRKAVRAVTQFYDEALRASGVRASQLGLLATSSALGTTTMNRLADFMVMDRTTLTRNLRPLEKQGLIRVSQGSDRREREITVTREGEELLANAYPLWQRAQTKVVTTFGERRMQRFLSDLFAIVEVVQAE